MDVGLCSGDFIFLKAEIIDEYRKVSAAPNFPLKAERPFCYVTKDPKKLDLFWAVPITSASTEKYKERAKNSPNRFRFYKINGKEHCFNISQLLPIRKEDINNVFIQQDKKVSLHKNDQIDLQKHVEKIIISPKFLQQVSNINVITIYNHIEKKLQLEKSQTPSLPKKSIVISPSSGMDRER